MMRVIAASPLARRERLLRLVRTPKGTLLQALLVLAAVTAPTASSGRAWRALGIAAAAAVVLDPAAGAVVDPDLVREAYRPAAGQPCHALTRPRAVAPTWRRTSRKRGCCRLLVAYGGHGGQAISGAHGHARPGVREEHGRHAWHGVRWGSSRRRS